MKTSEQKKLSCITEQLSIVYWVKILGLLLLTQYLTTSNALGSVEKYYKVDLPAQHVLGALTQLSEQTGVQVFFSYELAVGKKSFSVQGEFSIQYILDLMLKDTGLSGDLSEKGVVMITIVQPIYKKEERSDSMNQKNIISGKSKSGFLAKLIGALLGLQGGEVLAQTNAPSQGTLEIEEVIVTANKREQRLNSVPLSISAFTGEQIKNLGIKDVQDLVKIVPGLTYTETNLGRPVYTLRGIGFNATFAAAAPTVSIYVDEVPLPYSILTSGASLDLERVEILKGPQGILFGQNATGGAINYIAAKPTEEFEAGVDLEYGRFSHFVGEGYISGPLTDTLSGRLAIRTEQADAWQESFTQNLSLGEKNFTNFRGTINWKASEKLNATAWVSGFIDKNENQATQFITVDPSANTALLQAFVPQLLVYPTAPKSAREADWTGGQDLVRDNNMYQGAVRTDYSINPDLTFTSLTSYAEYNEDSLADYDGVSLRNNQMLADVKIKTFNQEIRVGGTLEDGRIQYVIGGNFEKTSVDESTLVSLPESSGANAIAAIVPTPVPLLIEATPTAEQDIETWAIFGNVDYEITSTISISGGLRYTKSKIDFEACTRSSGNNEYGENTEALANFLRGAFLGLPPITPLNAGDCGTFNTLFEPVLYQGNLDEDNVSWRAIIDWQPTEDTLIYTSVAQGYKAGSFPAISTSQAEQYEPVTQEKVIAYELGIKSTLIDRILQLNAATFYYDYTDKQVLNAIPVAVFGQLPALVNIPDSHVYGAEIQLTINPTPQLIIGLGATYIKSEIEDFTGFTQLGNIADHSGRPFPHTPEIQATANFTYNIPINDGWTAFVGGNLSYQDSTYASLEEDPLFKIDGYTLLDLRAGIESNDGDYSLSIWGRNVTDEYYWTASNTSLDTFVRIADKPATYGISLKYRF